MLRLSLPRFSGKVREEPQRRERKWGKKLCNQGFCDSQTQDERAYVEDVMKVERLSPHPFQPSQKEEVKQEDRGCSRNQGQTSG